LEQIVWCPVLLEDHNDMLEARDLPVSEQRFTEKQQRTSKSEFHPFSGWWSTNDLITLAFIWFWSKRLPEGTPRMDQANLPHEIS
jgi:hypothetical protein